MADNKKIKTALISVFHKDGLDEMLKLLNGYGVKFLSTGGTKSFIESLGYSCDAVEDLTGYPSILGGRVKTLHPKVFSEASLTVVIMRATGSRLLNMKSRKSTLSLSICILLRKL